MPGLERSGAIERPLHTHTVDENVHPQLRVATLSQPGLSTCSHITRKSILNLRYGIAVLSYRNQFECYARAFQLLSRIAQPINSQNGLKSFDRLDEVCLEVTARGELLHNGSRQH
jgi:hypothetical protein